MESDRPRGRRGARFHRRPAEGSRDHRVDAGQRRAKAVAALPAHGAHDGGGRRPHGASARSSDAAACRNRAGERETRLANRRCLRSWRTFALGLAGVLSDFLQDLHRGCVDGALARTLELELVLPAPLRRPSSAYLGFVLAMEVLLVARHGRLDDARRCLDRLPRALRAQRLRAEPAVDQSAARPDRMPVAASSTRRASTSSARRTCRLDHFAEPEVLMGQLSKALIAMMLYERGRIEDALVDARRAAHGPRRGVLRDPRAEPSHPRSSARIGSVAPAAADALLDDALQQARRRDATRLERLPAGRPSAGAARARQRRGARGRRPQRRARAAATRARASPTRRGLFSTSARAPRPAARQRAGATRPSGWRHGSPKSRRDRDAVRCEAVALVLTARARLPRDEVAAIEALRLALSLTA